MGALAAEAHVIPTKDTELTFSHMRGWLGVFAAYAVLGALVSTYNVVQLGTVLFNNDFARVHSSSLIGLLVYMALILGSIFGLKLMLVRSATTRRFWLALLAVKIPASIYTGFAVFAVMRASARQNGVEGPELDEYQVKQLQRLLVILIWILYWAFSRRVRELVQSHQPSEVPSTAA